VALLKTSEGYIKNQQDLHVIAGIWKLDGTM
jgi:hypothetical protein